MYMKYIFASVNTAGVDFVDIPEEVITFLPGEVMKCITFTAIEDDIVEGEESLTVQIQSSTLFIGVPNTADVDIIDSSRKYMQHFLCILI